MWQRGFNIFLDDDLKIEFADAEQSIEIKKGLAALLQTSADKEQRLLDIARRQHEQAERYRQLYEAEHTKNQALQTRYDALLCENEQLRNRPTHVTADKYVENFTVGQQIFALQSQKRKAAKHINLTNQLDLDLWKGIPAISLSTGNI